MGSALVLVSAVDAIVVACRSEERISACLRAVAGVPAVTSVVVVDHGDGESARRARELGATAVHDPATAGFGAGHNRGARIGRAPYLLVVNPSHRSVRAGIRHLAVGADHVERRPAVATDVASLAATAVLVRRTAFEAVGGFSTRYFLYGEDLDLCHRLTLAGWSLVALPDDWARHASGASAVSRRARELSWWRGTLTFAARWWGLAEWCGALSAAVVESARLTAVAPSEAGAVVHDLLAHPWRERISVRHRPRSRGGPPKPLASRPPTVP